MKKETIYFVMPAYNEEANIRLVVDQWHPILERLEAMGICARLAIANDGSKDGTYAILQNLQAEFPLLVPLDKPNSGHGATVLFLYRYALEHGADYIFQTDSDGQTNPEEFLPMWEHRTDYDFQIGHRLGRQDGFGRVFVTKTLRIVVWLAFHAWVKDANTPFRLMKSDKLKPIMDVLPSDFFLSNVAISAIAVKWGYRIGWSRITFKPRQGGVNSINMKRICAIGWQAIGDFWFINKNLNKR